MEKLGRGWFAAEARRRARNAIARNALCVVVVVGLLGAYLQKPSHRRGSANLVAVDGLLAALFAWRIVVAGRRRARPARHPLIRAFAQYGDPEALVAEVEAQAEAGAAIAIGAFVPSGRFLVHTAYPPEVVAYDDIAWAYVKETKHRVNFVPVGTTRSLEIFTFSKRHRYLQISFTVDERVLAVLERRMTRGRLGYSAANEAWWHATRQALTTSGPGA